MNVLPGTLNYVSLFSDYLKVTGVAHLGPEPAGDPALLGKRVGLLNGAAWIGLWTSYFGRLYLPGAHLVSIGNEAVQLSFMEAHQRGLPCPPASNIAAFVRYARDLVQLARVDAVLITCSTMNRAYGQVEAALAPMGVPVVQIDRPMMEEAARRGGKVLVVATHGPTIESTQALLREAAAEMGRQISFSGALVEEAWECLARGDVAAHNEALANAIRAALRQDPDLGCIVLAQLSMAVFLLSYPQPEDAFGLPVLTSAEYGFGRVREVLTAAR